MEKGSRYHRCPDGDAFETNRARVVDVNDCMERPDKGWTVFWRGAKGVLHWTAVENVELVRRDGE